MGLRVEVIKADKEDENFVYYIYQFYKQGEAYKSASGKTRHKSTLVSGLLKIDKKNGDVYVVEIADGDIGDSHARCASQVLIRHWCKGEYPYKAYFNS